ncbi:hypothetical protein Pmar_PMAR009147 [Perkinsus marinus ATCC 50983]|uniref:Uncharacterized protein n=1 Tax=Perkinsus marinus (strain ATCC 50983 / TXsc) TaxID=423536 RepID=C5KBK1_PERM5|nr:hypothetical protein Pmar_PMAR009147 [Perkinsus marinus ATCC 50983]EER18121.1 hypothetical protein Pmar_PMAR009147 [Perkinsus marinus ATCC 50983]|eukprot:XP_002786325.1 hypothetical protein Pmar_PMAR009147 [Perkinsus marinus ATCC 50983]
MVEEARDAIIRLGGGSVSAKDIVNPNTPLRPGLWKALTDMSGDWDTSLSGWLIEGAPIGVSAEIRPGGWFSTSTVATTDLPVTATGDESREWLGWFIGSADGAYVNYSSAESDPTNTWALLDEERKAGFCTFYDSFDDLAVAVGSRDVIVTKIALATKPNTDPPKYRLICDAKANSLNEVVHCREKIVLPRVSDVVQNIHELMEPARGASDCWSEIEFLAADFQNAFKLIPVQSMEQRFQVCYFQGRWILFHVLMFGVRICRGERESPRIYSFGEAGGYGEAYFSNSGIQESGQFKAAP